ncbi:hypothetical protein [Spiroplasma endosymbiont of Virgichneumon dumeticola]|uniref:hypothetical protein n=1 Tax=Spiroplasma endosymbiont of Virgichneumon dumeticola TaxID=3139323 RepID=UPI0035C89332
MKRLLKILSVLTLTTVPVTSVVSCGGASVPVNPTDDGIDIKDLLNKAQNKINDEFGNLINEEKNLFFENEFGNIGAAFKNVLSKMSATKEAKITDPDFIREFIKRMQENITDLIVPKLLEDQNLRMLFNGISKQNILKIASNNTKLLRTPFKWLPEEHVTFGLDNYNADIIKRLAIEYWYKITMDLKLELSYKDDKNQEQTRDLSQNYISYFANTGANISSVVKAASSKVKQRLSNQLININLTTNQDISNDVRLAKAKSEILVLVNKSELKIEKTNFDNVTKLTSSINSHVYNSSNQFYEAFNKSETASQTYLQTYLENEISKNFDKNLDDWIANLSPKEKQKIPSTIKPNITAFGKISLNNWTISGLSLQRITLNFINTRTNQTKSEWISSVSTSLANIFSLNGCIKDAFSIINSNKDLIMYMNNDDFNTYKNENKKMSDINDYFDDKIKQKAIAEGAILSSISFKVRLNGVYSGDSYNPNLDNREYIQEVDESTLKLIKNPASHFNYLRIEIDGLLFIFGSKQCGKNYLSFNSWVIKRASGPIWG